MGIGLLLGIAALAVLFGGDKGSATAPSEEISVTVVMGDQELWHFVATQRGEVIKEDGPFASREAAQTAADNWLATQIAGGAALAGCGCNGVKEAALGDAPQGFVQVVLPFVLQIVPDGVAIDIRDLHGMWAWVKVRAEQLGITRTAPAGVALRRVAQSIANSQHIVGVNFGSLGDEEWSDIMRFVRTSLRPFTWGHLLDLSHDRLHQLGYASLEEAAVSGEGRWRRGMNAPGGFLATPGVTLDALAPGSCAEFSGDGAWYTCCRDDQGRYTCRRSTSGVRVPTLASATTYLAALGQRHPSQHNGWGRGVRERGGSHAPTGPRIAARRRGPVRGPGPGETGVNAAGGLYVRTRGGRRL